MRLLSSKGDSPNPTRWIHEALTGIADDVFKGDGLTSHFAGKVRGGRMHHHRVAAGMLPAVEGGILPPGPALEPIGTVT